jgi:glycosyltransferase involved in cell wall biosynthesis
MKLDIICPVFNEEEVVGEFLRELAYSVSKLTELKNVDVKIHLVDDGSSDGTIAKIEQADVNLDFRILKLARNFGHQNAVWAGLESARNNSYCIVLDSDLQDPPIEILRIVEEFYQGADVVLMQRASRGDGRIKKFFANVYYKIQGNLTGGSTVKNVGDFFGLSPRALSALLTHQESIKYIRGLVAEIGFRRSVLEYKRQRRRHGYTHYTISKMFSLAVAGITGFSVRPLLWVVYGSVFGTSLGLIFISYVLLLKLRMSDDLTPGWAFAVISSTLFSVIILSALSVISVYLARVIQELKNRPVYIIDEQGNRLER